MMIKTRIKKEVEEVQKEQLKVQAEESKLDDYKKKREKVEKLTLKLKNLLLNIKYWQNVLQHNKEEKLGSEVLEEITKEDMDAEYEKFENLRKEILKEDLDKHVLLQRIEKIPSKRNALLNMKSEIQNKLSNNDKEIGSIKQELGIDKDTTKTIESIIGAASGSSGGAKLLFIRNNFE